MRFLFGKYLLIMAFISFGAIGCKSKEATPTVTVVPETVMAELVKSEALIRNESGNVIITMSFGDLTQENRTLAKKIFITNDSEKDKSIIQKLTDFTNEGAAFTIESNPDDSTCLGKTILKKYEKCSYKIILDKSKVGNHISFIYMGKVVIPIYANVIENLPLECGEGSHLSATGTYCEMNVIACPYAEMADGVTKATKEWDVLTNQYLPTVGCIVKDCNTSTHDDVYTDGVKSCRLKKYNINVVNNSSAAGVIIDTNNTEENKLIECGAICNRDYDLRSLIKLKAIPNDGFVFSKWEGTSCNGFTTNECLINYLNKNELILATFVETLPIITSSTAANKPIANGTEFYTNQTAINVKIQGTNLRYLALSTGRNCQNNFFQPYDPNVGFNVYVTDDMHNNKSYFSFKFKNFNKESSCFNLYVNHDTTLPTMTITDPIANTYFSANVPLVIKGSCSPSMDLVFSAPLSRTIRCVSGFYNESFLVPTIPDGPYEITVGQTTQADNYAYVSRSFIYDGTSPTKPTSITMPSLTLNKYTFPKITFTASTDVNPVSYEIALGTTVGGNEFLDWTNVGSNTTINYTSIQALAADTNYYLSIRAVDSLGNKTINVNVSSFTFRDTWQYAGYFDFIKPNVVKNSENFGTSMAYNKKYKTLFVKGKDSTSKDIIYVFEPNATTGKYEQKQILSYNFTDLDGFGDAMDSKEDYVYVSAPSEDSDSLANLNTNTKTDSGIVYPYKRVNGVWTQDSYIKSKNIGAANKFGVKLQASDDGTGVYVLSERDYSDRTVSTPGDTQGMVEYFNKPNTTWTYVTEYKVASANQTGNGEKMINFITKNLSVVITQQNTTNNSVYLLEKNGGSFVFKRAIDFSLSSIQNPEVPFNNTCLLNVSNVGQYMFIDEKSKLFTNGTSTSGSIKKCFYSHDISSNLTSAISETETGSGKMKMRYLDNNYIVRNRDIIDSVILPELKIEQMDYVSNTFQSLNDTKGIYIKSTHNSHSLSQIFKSPNAYNYSISDNNDFVGDDSNLFVSDISHGSCDRTNINITTCSNSGAIFYIKRNP